MYKSNNNAEGALFMPLHQEIVEKIRNDTLSLCSPFWINRNRDQEVFVMMTSHFMVLCEKNGLDYNYLYYTPLDFDLKFEVLG